MSISALRERAGGSSPEGEGAADTRSNSRLRASRPSSSLSNHVPCSAQTSMATCPERMHARTPSQTGHFRPSLASVSEMRSYVESVSFARFAASFAMDTSSRSTVDVICFDAELSVMYAGKPSVPVSQRVRGR